MRQYGVRGQIVIGDEIFCPDNTTLLLPADFVLSFEFQESHLSLLEEVGALGVGGCR